jgi:hypothetical protein
MRICGTATGHRWTVTLNGRALNPRRSQLVLNHSPDGFAWGYGGSGPAQLALAILLEAGVSDDRAVRLHQRFKAAFVTKWVQDFEVEVDVVAWITNQSDLY